MALNLHGCEEMPSPSILALEGYEILRSLGVKEPDLRPGALNYIKFRDRHGLWDERAIQWLKS